MIPLTVTASLSSAPIPGGPLLFDGILYAGLGAERGAAHPSGWVDAREVYAKPLPLARVETPWGWWWAASAAVLEGPEAVLHTHRRPPNEEYLRWTNARTSTHATGLDKALRIPHYRRIAMWRVRWTCVGEPRRVGELLARISALGRLTTHGHGWVERWDVWTTPAGPRTEDYGKDLRLRHLPAASAPAMPSAKTVRRSIPVRPPYYDRANAVDCWQVRGGA